MILKKLEIYGFKSFGKKTEIDFDSKVTGIVGPNGSGKSNITDAIRWVMGEQRVKPLRGSKMEDIIFSGTNEKKALGYAQVIMTLDNSSGIFGGDYKEICVMRRLFRSGESEYFINKSQCRLKDVQALFMDTGLGKEGYSIVGQGQIESIVINTPAERKLLIEEAAGIVKYRTRKTEAERKLERAQNNLYRITDILAELEGRLPSLKRQSEKAAKFVELRNQLKDMELGIFVHRMDILNERASKAYEDKEAFENSLSELDNQIEQNDKSYRTLQNKIGTYDENIKRVNDNIYSLMNEYQNARVNSQVAKSKIETYNQSLKDSDLENGEYDESIKELSIQRAKLEKELSDNREKLNSKAVEYDSFRQKAHNLLDDINIAQGKLKLLYGYENSLEGYQRAVQELIRAKQNHPSLKNGLYSTVGEIIDTKPEYATAITKALGGAMSYMVTEDEKIASDCIELLKTNKWGRVTFLPKNIIKPNRPNDDLKEIDRVAGFISFADKLVFCDAQFDDIVNSLLSRIAVCQDINSANNIAKAVKYKIKIVTLDGEVLFPGGAVSGGKYKNENEGSIVRRTEIKKLENLIIEKQTVYDSMLAKSDAPSEDELMLIREDSARITERIKSIKEREEYFFDIKTKKSAQKLAFKQEISVLEKQLADCFDIDSNYEKKRKASEDEFAELNKEKEASSKQYNRINDIILALNNEKTAVIENLSKVKTDIATTEYEISRLQSDMMENYSVTYAAALQYKQNIDDIQKSIVEVSALKEKIRRLGNINVDALEEYKEVQARYELMSTQKTDLVESKDELIKIIRDLSVSMTKQFMQQFELIQNEFDRVFKKLFSGGEAMLVLTDPEDIMNSGVDITAKPPNTKLRNIAALSGGEKAMTAISLIFAILKNKPSPFCVLDEIDAALDDANVVRLCEYMQTVINDNQFVIVTHKKTTMEIADTLYGVSKGKEGITQMLSVKLTDININEKGEVSA